MSDTNTNSVPDIRKTFRPVLLNTREQRALHALLVASDDGQVISGYDLQNTMILRTIRLRLGRKRT